MSSTHSGAERPSAVELYTKTSYELAELLTRRYSTSFASSSQLFDVAIRRHIYAIYGMVRIADEIVDTYRGDDTAEQLAHLRSEITSAINAHYNTNPLLHAFADTAVEFSITDDLIDPFFESMESDLRPSTFDRQAYERYIYGSAEVIGLMCLKVFTADDKRYEELAPGARALGAAYQKVNFLRDLKADYEQLGRVYFPGVAYDTFDDTQKDAIIADIDADFAVAREAVSALPPNSKRAVRTSFRYYSELLKILRHTPAAEIKKRRVRVPNSKKLSIFAKTKVGL